MTTKNIIQRGDIAKYQITIRRDDFDMQNDDFTVTLKWGIASPASMKIVKADMFHDEDWNVYFLFDTSLMLNTPIPPRIEIEPINTTKEDRTLSHNKRLSQKDRELFDLLHQEKEDDTRTFNKPGYKGIWAGVVDKYKEKAHFVYELLQNADDAKATEATFTLEKERLIFRHNGTVQFKATPQKMKRKAILSVNLVLALRQYSNTPKYHTFTMTLSGLR